MTTRPWQHQQFIDDMESAGIKWREYRGRNYYDGPAAVTTDDLTLQEITRATQVTIQTDSLGLDQIVYPK